MAAWRHRRPRSELNFPDVPNRTEAEFLAPPNVRVVNRAEELENRAAYLQLRREMADEELMAELRRNRPELVRAEEEYYAWRDAAAKKKAAPPPAPGSWGRRNGFGFLERPCRVLHRRRSRR